MYQALNTLTRKGYFLNLMLRFSMSVFTSMILSLKVKEIIFYDILNSVSLIKKSSG
ncbi:hypothetical protein BN131_307 [Cronobacter malonaticus 681]|nr:hypothetical protein BN131_305 [Cronobacter malonaticus 681]CCJ92634.1 hypothetical protein BN131_307 [Cronobacter malonaticus 681]